MPIKFNRAKMRVKDDLGEYTSAFDILSTQPMGTYIRQQVQPWVNGQINGSNIASSNPAYHNNAKFYSDSASTYATQASTYAQNLANFTADGENIVAAIGSIASAYDVKEHNTNDYAFYGGNLYKCTKQNSPALTDPSAIPNTYWRQVKVLQELVKINSTIKAILQKVFGIVYTDNWERIKNSNDYYYAYAGSVVGRYIGNVETPIENWSMQRPGNKSTQHSYELITTYLPCEQNDKVYIHAIGGTGSGSSQTTIYRTYGFLDNTGKILKLCAFQSSPTYKIITAPKDAAYVYVNNDVAIVPQDQAYLFIVKNSSIINTFLNS